MAQQCWIITEISFKMSSELLALGNMPSGFSKPSLNLSLVWIRFINVGHSLQCSLFPIYVPKTSLCSWQWHSFTPLCLLRRPYVKNIMLRYSSWLFKKNIKSHQMQDSKNQTKHENKTRKKSPLQEFQEYN